MTRLRLILKLAPLAATAALVLALAGTAVGQSAKPAPPCNFLVTDRKGDAEPENLDLTGLWFEYTGGKAYANMQINNLSTTVPSDATGILWYALWTLEDGVQYFVNAQVEFPSSEPTYNAGFVDTSSGATSVRTSQGDPPPGEFFPGPDGVIRIEIPADIGGTAGKVLKAAMADTQASLSILGTGTLSTVDETSAKAWTVAECAGAAPPTTPAPTPVPGTGGGGSNTEVVKNGLKVTVSKKVPKASKVKKSLAIKLTSSEKVTGIEAALLKGAVRSKNVVAKGKLSSVNGKGTLKLKVSKKLKKGSYTLYLLGKNADGRSADRTVKLKFK